MSGSAPAASEGKEEQYLFRCESEELAKRIRAVLRNNTKARKEDSDMDLRWVSDKEGVFTIGGSEYPCQLMDLPGIVESYKTYNDVHLVKSTDVGQVILVREPGKPPAPGTESRNGVTPPMRNGRRRFFKARNSDMDPFLVSEVEEDLQTLLSGHAIEGVKYTDVEEVWEEGEGGKGQWRPVVNSAKATKVVSRRAAPGTGTKKTPSKKGSKKMAFAPDVEEI